MRTRPIFSVVCPVAAAVALSLHAVAQAAEPMDDSDLVVLDEAIVTGSRIARDGYEAPTPVTVISSDELFAATANSSVRETLSTLPVFQGGYNLTTGAGVPSFNQAGVSTIEMRSLGINRTLVLLDGQRAVGSLANGVVDTDNFPQQLIRSVEVVTGGASAVYGSDAVAGVVNFILDRRFTGVKGEVSGGITDYGDGENYKIAASAGFPFAAGRGHVLLSSEIVDNKGVYDGVGKRDWGWTTTNYIANPAYAPGNGQPEFLLRDNVFLSSATHGGVISFGPLAGTAFGVGGTPYQFNYGEGAPRDLFMSGGDYLSTRTADAYSLLPKQERKNYFARVSYDITDRLHVYGQFSRGVSVTSGIAFPHYLTASRTGNSGGIQVLSGNPFIPDSVQARMDDLGLASFRVGTMAYDIPFVVTDTARAAERYVLGAEGNFDVGSTNWKWNSYAQIGRTEGMAYTHNARINANFNRAIDAVMGPNGTVMCRSTLTNPNNGCVPFNAMGTGVNSQAALDYILGTASSRQTTGQDVYAASITGDPFNNWAGPVSVALSAEHRKEMAGVFPDALAVDTGWHSGNHQYLKADTYVSEGAVEVLFPLLSGRTMAQDLDLSAAFRYTDYETSGGVETWKVGTTWTPISSLRLRATLSRDIRAPSISELFQEQNFGLITTLNPWTNVPNQHGRTQTGNPDLQPEIADNLTVGLVVRPEFVPGLSFSVDYWKTKIKDAIQLIQGSQIITLCGQGWTALCPRISFDPTGEFITSVEQGNFNMAVETGEGVDFEAGYRFPLASLSDSLPGNISMRVIGTRYIDKKTDNGITQVTQSVGSGLPKVVMNGTVNYNLGQFTAGLTTRYFDATVISNTAIECSSGCPTSTADARTYDEIDRAGGLYFDASVGWRLSSLMGKEGSEGRLYFNVRNLTNKDPELTPGVGTTGLSYIYSRSQGGRWDKMGRTYRVGMEFRF